MIQSKVTAPILVAICNVFICKSCQGWSSQQVTPRYQPSLVYTFQDCMRNQRNTF